MLPAFAIAFLALAIFRYARLLIAIYANMTYQPYPVKAFPKFSSEDVSVVISTTLKHPAKLMLCLRNVLRCRPAKIIIVTANASVAIVEQLIMESGFQGIVVRGVQRLHKREQMLHGLQIVDTSVVVFADDDVVWPVGFLRELLAIFEDPTVGAGGPCQRVHREARPGLWNYLAIAYLERRVFNNIATQAIDRSISTLSGRTCAFRTEILKTPQFIEYFLTDSWLGQRLNSDDDKAITRWIYSTGWNIAIQSSVCIETRMEDGFLYIFQCLR